MAGGILAILDDVAILPVLIAGLIVGLVVGLVLLLVMQMIKSVKPGKL